MANTNCDSCNNLNENNPELIVNGFTSSHCTSLKNDTGLKASVGHNDCTDLDHMNNCLIGNMEEELKTTDICDWKDFMSRFIPNIWTVLKAIICAICGIWTNIHNLWAEIQDIWTQINNLLRRMTQAENDIDGLENGLGRIDCLVDYLSEGHDFSFGEYTTDSNSYIIAGKGVSFLNVSSSGTAADIKLRYVAGGMAMITGSCLFYTSSFTDGATVYNFDDNGTGTHRSKSRSGNSVWSGSDAKPIAGGELAYEIMLKKSQYPQIGAVYSGIGLEGAGGAYHVLIRVTNEGKYAWGQHGYCNTENGNPAATGADRGHLVKGGYISIQVRISYMDKFDGEANGHQYTPGGLLPLRIAQSGISC